MKKLASVLLGLLLLFNSVGCADSSTQQPLSSEIGSVDVTDQQPPKSYEEQKSLYDGIISEYSLLLADKYNGNTLSSPDTKNMDPGEIAIAEALYGIVNNCQTAQAAQDLGYGYKDLDSDGTPELILLSKYASVRAIFTISENLPILLESAYGANTSFHFATGNRFLLRRTTISDNIEENICSTCHVSGDKMVYDTVYGAMYDREKREIVERFQIVNGARTTIDEDTYHALDREMQMASRTNYSTISKLQAPLIHLPLSEKEPDTSLPVADFSSYAAIRNTYNAICCCLETFNSSEWELGAYDNLFTFPSDSAFEYYTKLLYIAYHIDQPLGYDEIDLNGDGENELVLLNEDYGIKAIFTQKNGSPILLDAFVFWDHTCFLDSNGLIHVDYEGYSDIEYSLYEFTKSGEYQLHFSIIVDTNGRYLTRDGKIKPISFEESLEIFYNDYVCYPDPFSPNEYTRNVTALAYTPMIETTDDKTKMAIEKTWHKYANLERSTDYAVAYSNAYVTFENLTDTQVDMNLKYVFTYGNPDPEQSNQLLTDVMESTLHFTVQKENGVFRFDENGLQGKVEFGQEVLWIIVENSSDERFSVGHYCHVIASVR